MAALPRGNTEYNCYFIPGATLQKAPQRLKPEIRGQTGGTPFSLARGESPILCTFVKGRDSRVQAHAILILSLRSAPAVREALQVGARRKSQSPRVTRGFNMGTNAACIFSNSSPAFSRLAGNLE
jgi:hypothetical protein